MSLITLSNRSIEPVIWERGELCDFIVNDQIDIWQINVNENLSHIDNFRDILNQEEIKRADKYIRKSDGNRFITSRCSLRTILSGYLKQPPAAIRFKLAENNKPYIANPGASQLHFNLSDSADRVLIAIARSAVGIDIELVKPEFRYHDILNNNFSIPEAEYINLRDSCKRFFLLWTRKEAILKATGVGLTDHLKLIQSLDGDHVIDGGFLSTAANWQLNSFETGENYIAAVATNTLINNFRFWNFSFE